MSQELERPPRLIYRLARRATQFSMVWAFLWMPSSCNRLMLYINASNYQPVSFKVTDAVYDPNSDTLAPYWLTGTVKGHEERLIPPVSRSGVNSSEDLLKLFPKGIELPAMYNSSMPGLLFQGESLRLRYDNGKFWETEVKGGSWLLKIAFLPILSAMLLKTLLLYKRREN